jgi:pyridinium-3,5-biscarboxylic acid mononucleotide synthase
MKKEYILEVLKDLKAGRMSVDDAFHKLKAEPYADLGFAKFDTLREARKGYPESVFCQGKSLEHITGIVRKMKGKIKPLVLTRASQKVFRAVKKAAPSAKYHAKARIISIGALPAPVWGGYVLVITAGTADQPVAEEAAVMAQIMGCRVERMVDCGVAGIHRLLGKTEVLFKANVVVAVAGMEGALPSIVAGLVDKPVIAVPTSVGYGASFGGVAPLLTMLNSCAPGIAVVNIDNGFGAGYLAAMINKMGSGPAGGKA